MFKVTYELEGVDGKKKATQRDFFDEAMALSEETFQPGVKLNDGAVIKRVSVEKVK